SDGLDRFREFAVPTISVKQGLSSTLVSSLLAARDGSVWLNATNALNRWSTGQITVYRERAQNHTGSGGPPREIVGSGLPERGVESFFEDDRGRIVILTLRGVGYVENDRFISIAGIPEGYQQLIAQDGEGSLWIGHQDFGLFRVSRDKVIEQIPWSRLGRPDKPRVMIADRLHGGLWFGFYLGGVAYFVDGQVRKFYSAADGLAAGLVNDFLLEPDGVLWAATGGGLSRLKDGRVATLTSKNGLHCDNIHWLLEDEARSLWMQ